MGIGTTSPTTNFQVAQGTAGVGRITTTASGTAVVGTGTQFTNTFKLGNTITANGETRTIVTISNDTHLTTNAWTNTNTNVAYTLAGGTRFSVLGNGNVGIGAIPRATAPLEVWDDSGNSYMYFQSHNHAQGGVSGLRIGNKSPDTGSAAISFERNDVDKWEMGIDATTQDEFALGRPSLSGIDVLRVDANGKMSFGAGIGSPAALTGQFTFATPTTAPTLNIMELTENTPNRKGLSLLNNSTADGASALIQISTAGTGNLMLETFGSGYTTNPVANQSWVHTSNNTPLVLGYSGLSQGVTINNGAVVGIAQAANATTSRGKLDVFGTSGLPGNYNVGIMRIRDIYQASLSFGTYGSASPYGSWIQSGDADTSTLTPYPLFLQPSGGNVGIGTTSPTNILSLGNGAARKFWIENTATDVVGRALTVAAGSTVAGTSTSDVTGGNLILQAGLGTGTGASTISFQTGTTLTTGTTLQTMSTKMTILGNGNVGIGITTPSNIFHVTGTPAAATHVARIANTLGGTTQNNGLLVLAGNDTGVSASELITFQRTDATVIGSISQNAATTVAFNTSSDFRIKENVTPTTYGLPDLLKINVADFTFINDSNKQKMTGFIAQELNKIFPEAVTTNGDNGIDPLTPGQTPWMVDYSKLTPLLVKSIQDLNLNLDTITGTVTPAVGSPAESFFTAFFKNLFTKITTWLADAGNGVAKIFTGEIETKTLCVSDNSGAKTCITKTQLDSLLSGAGVSSGSGSDSGGGSGGTPPTPPTGGDVSTTLAAAKAAETLLVATDYVDYSAVTTALALPEGTDAEKTAKTTAINSAIAGLVKKDSGKAAAKVPADLTQYNTAIAAVVETNFTAESWTAYQGVVSANIVTIDNTQAEVDTATNNIIAAQSKLVSI
jgi:hypothetical protein